MWNVTRSSSENTRLDCEEDRLVVARDYSDANDV